jgi:hypothetical protein
MDFYGRRNDVLFAWHNVPMPALLFHLIATTKNGIAFGFRVGRPWRMICGLLKGYLDCAKFLHRRKPVDAATYKLSRMLKKNGPFRIQDVENYLPRNTPESPPDVANQQGL